MNGPYLNLGFEISIINGPLIAQKRAHHNKPQILKSEYVYDFFTPFFLRGSSFQLRGKKLKSANIDNCLFKNLILYISACDSVIRI